MAEVASEPVGSRQVSISNQQRVRNFLQYAGMLPVLIILCIGFGIENGRFFSLTNASIVLQQAAINTVLAAGMTFVILTAGIDLSVGSILAASAMGALMVSLIPDIGMLGIVAGLLIGLGFGAINGFLIAVIRLPPFIVTLGSLTAVRGIARLLGADRTVFNPSLPFAFIGNATLFGVSWLVIIAMIVVLISWFILRRTVLGTRTVGICAWLNWSMAIWAVASCMATRSGRVSRKPDPMASSWVSGLSRWPKTIFSARVRGRWRRLRMMSRFLRVVA